MTTRTAMPVTLRSPVRPRGGRILLALFALLVGGGCSSGQAGANPRAPAPSADAQPQAPAAPTAPGAPAAEAVRIELEYEKRQCVGDNNLSPDSVRRALEAAAVKVVSIESLPTGRVMCQACYPHCTQRHRYGVEVPRAQEARAREVITGLERHFPAGETP